MLLWFSKKFVLTDSALGRNFQFVLVEKNKCNEHIRLFCRIQKKMITSRCTDVNSKYFLKIFQEVKNTSWVIFYVMKWMFKKVSRGRSLLPPPPFFYRSSGLRWKFIIYNVQKGIMQPKKKYLLSCSYWSQCSKNVKYPLLLHVMLFPEFHKRGLKLDSLWTKKVSQQKFHSLLKFGVKVPPE